MSWLMGVMVVVARSGGNSLVQGLHTLLLLSSCLMVGLGLVHLDLVSGGHSNLTTCVTTPLLRFLSPPCAALAILLRCYLGV